MSNETLEIVKERCTKSINDNYDRRIEEDLNFVNGCGQGGATAGGIAGARFGGLHGAAGGVIGGLAIGVLSCAASRGLSQIMKPSRDSAVAQCVGESALGQMSAPPLPEGNAQTPNLTLRR